MIDETVLWGVLFGLQRTEKSFLSTCNKSLDLIKHDVFAINVRMSFQNILQTAKKMKSAHFMRSYKNFLRNLLVDHQVIRFLNRD